MKIYIKNKLIISDLFNFHNANIDMYNLLYDIEAHEYKSVNDAINSAVGVVNAVTENMFDEDRLRETFENSIVKWC